MGMASLREEARDKARETKVEKVDGVKEREKARMHGEAKFVNGEATAA